MLICRCRKRELLAKTVLSFSMNIAKQSNCPGTIYIASISCSSLGDWRGGEEGREGAVSTEHLSDLQLPVMTLE